jgi:hypothetical protein
MGIIELNSNEMKIPLSIMFVKGRHYLAKGNGPAQVELFLMQLQELRVQKGDK